MSIDKRSHHYETESLSEDVHEGIEDIKCADEYLKENDAAGILIGGKAFAFVTGAHPIEIERRKDVDVLVLKNGQRLSHNSQFDLFLPDGEDVYRNRNDFVLPYHIHYIGETLEPGIHLPPPEVIFLTESEMATRRAIDRIIPDIIQHRFSPIASQFRQLDLKDIILEFPGDCSWLGSNLPNFPMQVVSKKREGIGRRTFLSFNAKSELSLPQTAFPTHKEVRSPEFNNLDVLPEVELEPDEIFSTGISLIKNGFVKEGMGYILDKAPKKADCIGLLHVLLDGDNISNYPIQTADAFGMWLKEARSRNFITIFLLSSLPFKRFGITLGENRGMGRYSDPDSSRLSNPITQKIEELAKSIGKSSGMRFQELRERLQKFSFDNFISEDELIGSPELKEILKKILSDILYGTLFSRHCGSTIRSNDFESFGVGEREVEIYCRDIFEKIDPSDSECDYFNGKLMNLKKDSGITNREIINHLQAKRSIHEIFEAPKPERRFWDRRIIKRGKYKTPREIISRSKTANLEGLYQCLLNCSYDPTPWHRAEFIADMCGFESAEECRDALLKRHEDNDDIDRDYDFFDKKIKKYFEYTYQ